MNFCKAPLVGLLFLLLPWAQADEAPGRSGVSPDVSAGRSVASRVAEIGAGGGMRSGDSPDTFGAGGLGDLRDGRNRDVDGTESGDAGRLILSGQVLSRISHERGLTRTSHLVTLSGEKSGVTEGDRISLENSSVEDDSVEQNSGATHGGHPESAAPGARDARDFGVENQCQSRMRGGGWRRQGRGPVAVGPCGRVPSRGEFPGSGPRGSAGLRRNPEPPGNEGRTHLLIATAGAVKLPAVGLRVAADSARSLTPRVLLCSSS